MGMKNMANDDAFEDSCRTNGSFNPLNVYKDSSGQAVKSLDTAATRLHKDAQQRNTAGMADERSKVSKPLESSIVREEWVIPDGGLKAWSIVVASFMILLSDGIRNSFGLLLPTIVLHFKSGRTEAALTNSLMNFLKLGFSPIVAELITRFGHRAISLVGITTMIVGFVLAGVSVEAGYPIYVLHTTAGVMGGLGLALLYLPAVDIICKYFDRNLGLAVGIATSGCAIGNVVMCPLVYQLNNKLGLGLTLVVLGGLFSPGVFFIALFDTPPSNLGGEETKKPGFKVYRGILRDPKMLLLLLSHALVTMSSFTGFVFTADMEHQLDIEVQFVTIIYFTMAVFSFLGRIIFGKILDMFREKSFILTTVMLVLLTGVLGASIYMPGLTGQLVFAGLFGFSFGSYASSNIIILQIMCKDTVKESFGLCLAVFALSSIVSPGAIVGPMFDATGSYRLGYLVVTVLGLGGALVFALLAYLTTREQNQALAATCEQNYEQILD